MGRDGLAEWKSEVLNIIVTLEVKNIIDADAIKTTQFIMEN